MKVKYLTVLALAIGMLIVCAPSFAHHGSAATFESKTTTTKGTVVEWVWSNPHCLLRFDEKTDSGEVRHWVVETQAPANMIDAGWSKNSFKPGEEVTVDIRPAKSGKFVGILNKVCSPTAESYRRNEVMASVLTCTSSEWLPRNLRVPNLRVSPSENASCTARSHDSA